MDNETKHAIVSIAIYLERIELSLQQIARSLQKPEDLEKITSKEERK